MTTTTVSKPFEVMYVAHDAVMASELMYRLDAAVSMTYEPNPEQVWKRLGQGQAVDLFIVDNDIDAIAFLAQLQRMPGRSKAEVILVGADVSDDLWHTAKYYKVLDVFLNRGSGEALVGRIQYLIRRQHYQQLATEEQQRAAVANPLGKRLFDILLSASVLLVLSPVLLLVAIIIRLESPGPIIYRSKRVGAGMRLFTMYKFRTMYQGADQMIGTMKAQNVYSKPAERPSGQLCSECARTGTVCRSPLLMDNEQWCEKEYLRYQKQRAIFNKFSRDPRVTRVGQFLRDSSLDEIPQLFNVLIGDMSVVGNRPLPLYEAEKLTVGEHIERFSAPAGLTGLWQVTKRARPEQLSDAERISLDLQYARELSLGNDLRIILKTMKALWQKESM